MCACVCVHYSIPFLRGLHFCKINTVIQPNSTLCFCTSFCTCPAQPSALLLQGLLHFSSPICRVTQNHIYIYTVYIRCIYGNFGREITKYTVIYGAFIRFWPTLPIWCSTLHAVGVIYYFALLLHVTHKSSHTWCSMPPYPFTSFWADVGRAAGPTCRCACVVCVCVCVCCVCVHVWVRVLCVLCVCCKCTHTCVSMCALRCAVCVRACFVCVFCVCICVCLSMHTHTRARVCVHSGAQYYLLTQRTKSFP